MNINEINTLVNYKEEIDALNSENFSYYAHFFRRKDCENIIKTIKPYLNDSFYNMFFNYFMKDNRYLIPLLVDHFCIEVFFDLASFSNTKYTLHFIEYLPDIILSCKKQIDENTNNTVISMLKKSLFYQKASEMRKNYEILLENHTYPQFEEQIFRVIHTIGLL